MDIEQTESQSNRQSKTSLFQQREILLPLITAVIATYIHFWGYAYLKGKLQMVGLGDIEIELSILESVYQASLSFRDIVNGMINASLSGLIYTITILSSALILVIFMYSIYHYLSGFTRKKSNETPTNTDFPHSIIGSLKIGTIQSFEAFAVMGIIVVFFLGFAAISNLLLSIPRAIGLESGKTYIEKAVCKDTTWEEINKDRFVSCTRIEALNQSTQERELHLGVILFKNNQYTIMVTNQKSLLLDNQNKVIAWSDVFERENDDH